MKTVCFKYKKILLTGALRFALKHAEVHFLTTLEIAVMYCNDINLELH
jgi:hypothetical protein